MSRYRDLVDRYPLDPTIVGWSPAIEYAVSVASRVATSNVMLLLTGKSGAATDR